MNLNLETTERQLLDAIVSSAKSGNATAASQGLLAVQRIRDKNSPSLHRELLDKYKNDGCGMASYLATLGLSIAETEKRMQRKLTDDEVAAWHQGQDDRLLEVRAVELQRMRSTGEIPRWATRRIEDASTPNL